VKPLPRGEDRQGCESHGSTSDVGGPLFHAGARSAVVAAPMLNVRESRVRFVSAAVSPMAVAMSDVKNLGPDIMNDTWVPKKVDRVTTSKPWYIIDAKGATLGRLATVVANYLRGKNVPTFDPSADVGAYVVIINAEHVEVTGRKETDKLYRRHTTGRPGSMKVETFKQLQKRLPERIVEKAVKGMLPKNALARRMFTHMKVYKGEAHPHEAQDPIDISFELKQKQRQI